MTLNSQTDGRKVYVIDDDEGMRIGLDRLLRSCGFEVVTFSTPIGFLRARTPTDRGCLLLDIRFPDVNGLDFQAELLAADIFMPVIIMTGYADVPSSIRGLKSGATDFLLKPFDDHQLIAAVELALEAESIGWIARAEIADADRRYALLTTREKEVLAAVTAGLMNKQIAADLKLSEITVKIHRGTMMRKMGAKSVPDLVRTAVTLKISNVGSMA